MDLYTKKNSWSFADEADLRPNPPLASTPLHPALRSHHQLPRSSSANMISLSPPSPCASPWRLSPPRPLHSPSLLYHCLASLQRQDGHVLSLAASRGLLFAGSDSDRVRAWKLPECADRGYVRTRHGGVRAVLAHGSTLFTAHRDHRARVWTVSLSDHRLRASKVATLPPKSSLAAFPFAGRWRASAQHKDTISCLAYSQAEGLLYTGSWDCTVKAWRVAERRCVDSFVAHEGRVNAILVNVDDGGLFTASSDGTVKIWRRVFGDSSHTLTMTLRFQPSPVNALALSHSGESCFLYSGSSDGSINFWEKEALYGRYNHGGFLNGHRFAVLCLAAVERLVFSGSEDTTIRVWRREDGGAFHVCLAVLEGHRGPVRCVAACLELEKVAVGFLVYSASLDRMVKVWRIKVVHGEPAGKAAGVEEGEVGNAAGKDVDYGISPVLSPSWVERKLQRGSFC